MSFQTYSGFWHLRRSFPIVRSLPILIYMRIMAEKINANLCGCSVISMHRLQIPVLPSIVTAGLLTLIVSGGNAYTFNASRSLHALALDGQAPKFLRRLNKKSVRILIQMPRTEMLTESCRGVPYMAVIVVMLLACLSYLALGSGSAKVLNWILKSVTVGPACYLSDDLVCLPVSRIVSARPRRCCTSLDSRLLCLHPHADSALQKLVCYVNNMDPLRCRYEGAERRSEDICTEPVTLSTIWRLLGLFLGFHLSLVGGRPIAISFLPEACHSTILT